MGKKKKNCKPGSGSSPCLAQRQPPNRPRLTFLQSYIPGENVGEQLKNIRLAKGLRIEDVCEAIKESPVAVYRVEANSGKTRPELVKKLADLYNCQVGIFIKTVVLKVRTIIRP